MAAGFERKKHALFRLRDGIIGEARAPELISICELRMMQMPSNSAPPSRIRRPRGMRQGWPAALCLMVFLTLIAPAGAIQLVTEQEAALPPDHLPGLALRGSPSRRPSAVVVSPPPNAGQVTSPLSLKVKLQAFGGAKIDPDSVVVTYKKTPMIDITQRIMPFIKADGIEVPEAEVPPGRHEFRIELKDKDGRLGGTDFSFQVGK
jgi:hypothetical protein